mgnify:FL=1|jgi:hypothetical protein
MEAWNPTYDELEDYYSKYFSLGHLSCDIGSKFALVSLICFLTKQARVKNPDATCYQVIMKIIDGEESSHDMTFIRGLSIVCTDIMKNCNEYLTFDMKSSKEMVKKIKDILHTWLPF